MVYLGMGPGAYKISKPLDAGFILFLHLYVIIAMILLQNNTSSLKLLHVFVVATAGHARTNAENNENDDN